ncbi:MAG: ribonuclease H-like domain-containing protein [Tahibacter sp.]
MSTVERLKRLQRQAGAFHTQHSAIPSPVADLQGAQKTHALPSTARSDPMTSRAGTATIEHLRRLLRLRPPTVPTPVAPRCSTLIGEEILPGLRQIERCYAVEPGEPIFPPRWHSSDAVARDRFVCFDTETTGLSGGSGTRAFMIGVADWHGESLRVRQLYTTTLGAEAAMLSAFASWLRPDSVLVSYNGRSYDAPLLTTRFRLQRLANPLVGIPHVDLLHPVRRRYRGVWGNCKLATIERHALHIHRDDDLPGSEAPAAWLAYLRRGETTNLMRVLEHNRQDVVTLAQLLEHMAVSIEVACRAPEPR